jgi:branched-chain amino acid transport system permease protein
VLVAALVYPLVSGAYDLFLGTSAVVSAVVLLSLGVLSGDAGMPSLCQISFAAVSACVFTQFAAADHPLPLVVQVLASTAVAAVLGAVVSLPALRLRSVNLAVVTLGVAGAVGTVLNAPRFGQVFADRPGILAGDEAFYVFTVVCFAALAALLGFVRRRPTGVAWKSVKNSERATAALGVSVVRAKVTAFATSAAVAGFAGVLTVLQLGIVAPTNFLTTSSLVVFAAALFIGSWRWQGALLAGVVATLVPELVSRAGLPQDLGNLVFAVGAIQALAGGVAVADRVWPQGGRRGRGAVDATAWDCVVAQRSVAAPTGAPALEVRGVTVRYGGITAVDGVDLHVDPAEVVGLVGANGAGKSSIIDALSGFAPATGDVVVAGRPLTGPPQRRARHGLRRTFQQDRVVTTVTVGQYLRLAAGRRLPADELEALVAFSSAPSAGHLVGDLEGAARRLLEVAAAFAARPAVVLLDEPVAGLSAAEALVFARSLRAAPAVFGCGVLLVEHDVDFVRAVCTRAVALDFGRVVAGGTPEEVFADPTVRAAYMGDAVGEDDPDRPKETSL